MRNFNLKHFRASHLMQLRNQEFSTAYDEILRVFANKEITIDFVAENYESAMAESEKLTVLRNMNKKHHLTKTITKQKNSRFNYFSFIIATAKNALKSPSEEQQKAGKVINEWVEPYKKSLKRPLLAAQTAVTSEMADEIAKVSHVAEAIESLSLFEVVTSIKLATMEIKHSIKLRNEEMAEAARKTRTVKRSAYAKMMIFLNSIEMVINMNDENKAEYMDYAEKINRFLNFYEAAIMSRSTRFKNAAEKDEMDSDKGNNTEGAIETNSTTPKSRIAMETTPYNVMTLNDGVDMDVHTVETMNEDSTTSDDALNVSEIENEVKKLTQNGTDKFDQED